MKRVAALIFDLDGTLIDSSRGVIEAVNYSLRRTGCPEQPPERITRFIGFPLSQMYAHFNAGPFEQLRVHFHARAAEVMVASAEPLDGVGSVLADLRGRGLRLAVATTKIRSHVSGIVAKFGWEAYFDALVASDDVVRVKPDPDAFRLALERMGASSTETMVVGDTINDVLGARAVPLPVVAVASPYGGRDELRASRPDHFLESLAELPALLDRLEAER